VCLLHEKECWNDVGNKQKKQKARNDGAEDREHKMDKDDAEGVSEAHRGQVGKKLG